MMMNDEELAYEVDDHHGDTYHDQEDSAACAGDDGESGGGYGDTSSTTSSTSRRTGTKDQMKGCCCAPCATVTFYCDDNKDGGDADCRADSEADGNGDDDDSTGSFLMDVVRSRASRREGGGAAALAGVSGGSYPSSAMEEQQAAADDNDDDDAKRSVKKEMMGKAVCLDLQPEHQQEATAAPAPAPAAHMEKATAAALSSGAPPVASYPNYARSTTSGTSITTSSAKMNQCATSSSSVPLPTPTLETDRSSGNVSLPGAYAQTPTLQTDRSSGNLSLPGAFAQTPSHRRGLSSGGGSISLRQLDQHDETDSSSSQHHLATASAQQQQEPVIGNDEENMGHQDASSMHPSSVVGGFTGLESTGTFTGLSSMCENSAVCDNSALLAAELVPHYEEADILQQDVILLSPQEKEKMAHCKKRLLVLIAALIALVGTGASIAFMTIGITKALQEQDDKFKKAAQDTIQNIHDAFEEYVNAVASVHTRCRKRDFSRQDFRDMYETLLEQGLQFKAVQFYPNTTHAERPAREADSRAFYAKHYPHVDYRGFVGFNNLDGSGGLQPRQEEPWYFPVHYMEPIPGNEAAIDLDYHSSEVRIRAINAVFENQKPSLSDRLNLVKKKGQISRCGNHNGPSYGVVLAHPGIKLTRTSHPTNALANLDDYHDDDHHSVLEEKPAYNASNPDAGFVDDVWPRDLAAMVVCIPDLLMKSLAHHDTECQSKAIYIHDQNHLSPDPVFMGGAQFHTPAPGAVDTTEGRGGVHKIVPDSTFLDEVPLEELKSPSQFQQLKYQEDVPIANRIWTVTVVATEGTYKPQYMFVLVGGVIIVISTLLVASWVYRMSTSTEEEAAAEGGEKNNNDNEEGIQVQGGSSTAAMWMEEGHA